MVLHRTGVNVEPDALVGSVYIPERKGSLQVEMAAAVRQMKRLAVEVTPSLAGIVAELEEGRPVLILQNLGVSWLPVWHYAVVIGFNAQAQSFVLRSGKRERLTMSTAKFDRTWRKSQRWAIVVLSPGELPADDSVAAYTEAVVGLETAGQIQPAARAYAAGLERWPRDKMLLFGRANAAYRQGNSAEAIAGYREVLLHHPGYLPAINNLAHVLGEVGCRNDAIALLDTVERTPTLNQTREQVEKQPPSDCVF
jgi:tetratricopeptide (TPR) repeat protein